MSVTLSHYWNWAVDMVMWPKFVNSSISLREIIITSFLYGFDKKKKQIFLSMVLVQFIYLGLVIVINLKFYISLVKELKLKVKNFED